MTEDKDKKLEEMKGIAGSFCQLYEYIHKAMGFVNDDQARTSATATVFIATREEYKSLEYKREQQAKKIPAQPILATSSFQTGTEFKKKQETKIAHATPPTEFPKADQAPEGIFGTDRWGKTWPRSLTCLNLIPKGEGKFELCGGVAQVMKSIKKAPDGTEIPYIYAICPKCNHFLKHDGKAGRLAQPMD